MSGSETSYASCFDFPETPPMFAGWAGNGTPGLAPSLNTAMRFEDEETAERFLLNSYGPNLASAAVVVEVAP